MDIKLVKLDFRKSKKGNNKQIHPFNFHNCYVKALALKLSIICLTCL